MMANQAFGRTEDLLFGSGELYIAIDNDGDEWKHLGNVDEFTITTDVDAIEKNTSMGTKRELLERTTTALSITAEATLTEYDYKNVAMALFGEAGINKQVKESVIKKDYYVNTVPGIVTVTNSSNTRAFGITDVTVYPSSLSSRAFWVEDERFGNITSDAERNDTFETKAGGLIHISTSNANITERFSVFVSVIQTPNTVGDLDGLKVQIYDESTDTTLDEDFGTGTSETVTLSNGIDITFEVDSSGTFDVMSTDTEEEIEAKIIPPISSYERDIDYIVDEQSCRAGIIKIPSDSNIIEGDTIQVTYTIPNKNLYVISGGGSRKDIVGRLLFVSDANTGPNYVIEGWKVHIYPEGDLAGLITNSDFGSYKIKFSFVTDYNNHPEAPHFAMTLVDYGQQDISSGTYNAEY